MADESTLIELTADIVAAHVSNNTVAVGDVGTLVQQVHTALAALGQNVEVEPDAKVPVVSVRASIKPDYIVCMECGKKQKMLKRHLLTAHGMSPEQYRNDYGLPASYPMVAENYSERRRALAMEIGLGRKPGEKPGKGGPKLRRGRGQSAAAPEAQDSTNDEDAGEQG